MERVGKFEKVSYEQFYAAIKDCFSMDDSVIRDLYDGIELPTRATSGSAGYDFNQSGLTWRRAVRSRCRQASV